MALTIGALREVAITKESTRGTAVAPASGDFIVHEGHSFMTNMEKISQGGGDGTLTLDHGMCVAKEWTQGTIPMALENTSLYLVGDMIAGQNPVTTGAGPQYTHDYTFLGNLTQRKTYTVSYTEPNVGDLRSPGAMPNTLTLSANVDERASLEVEMIGKTSESTSYSETYASTPSWFCPSTVTIKRASNYNGLAGAAAVDIKDFTFNMNFNLATEASFDGSTDLSEIAGKRIEITGSYTIRRDSATYRDLFVDNTQESISFNVTNGNFELTIELPAVQYEGWEETTDLDGVVDDVMTFRANNLDFTNNLVVVQVKDETATHT